MLVTFKILKVKMQFSHCIVSLQWQGYLLIIVSSISVPAIIVTC